MSAVLTQRQRDIADEHAGDYEKDNDRLPTRWELAEVLFDRAREEAAPGPVVYELLDTARTLRAGAPFGRLSECEHDGRTYTDEDAGGRTVLVCAMCDIELMAEVNEDGGIDVSAAE
jgi:hypothetical protein